MTVRRAGAAARLLAAFSLLLALSAQRVPAQTAPVPGRSASADTAHCVDASLLDLRRILPPPPRVGSRRNRAELDDLLHIQARRTASEVDLARRDVVRSALRFAAALGDPSELNAEQLPRTLALFDHVESDEIAVLAPAKHAFARPRPFTVEPRLAPVTAPPTSPSYPSGHSTWAYTTALVLADMVPERRAQLLARADQYAHNRMVAGEHYPSDVEAGKLAGTALAAMLFTCPAFAREEASARKELRRVLRLP